MSATLGRSTELVTELWLAKLWLAKLWLESLTANGLQQIPALRLARGVGGPLPGGDLSADALQWIALALALQAWRPGAAPARAWGLQARRCSKAPPAPGDDLLAPVLQQALASRLRRPALRQSVRRSRHGADEKTQRKHNYQASKTQMNHNILLYYNELIEFSQNGFQECSRVKCR